MANLEFLGCSFFNIYCIQKTAVRFGLKRALEISEKTRVSPDDLIKTEKNQNWVKIMEIIDNFDTKLFDKNMIEVLNWGCGMLILNGHHRAVAAHTMGIEKININMHRFLC